MGIKLQLHKMQVIQLFLGVLTSRDCFNLHKILDLFFLTIVMTRLVICCLEASATMGSAPAWQHQSLPAVVTSAHSSREMTLLSDPKPPDTLYSTSG